MRIPDNLKLNKFVFIRIPKLSAEFAKHGFMATLPQNYSGDELVPTNERKSDKIAGAVRYAEKTEKEKENK